MSTEAICVLAAVKDGTDKWGLMGTDGKWLMIPAYKSLSYAGKGVFMTAGKRGTAYVDKQGAPVVWPEKEAASVHFFKDQGRYGIQDKNGNIVVAPMYKAVLANFSEGLAFVKDDKGAKVAIDESGRVQFAAPYDAAAALSPRSGRITSAGSAILIWAVSSPAR